MSYQYVDPYGNHYVRGWGNDFTEEEVKDWIDTLNQSQFEKISAFFTGMPSLKHTVTWKCGGCGEEDSIEIEGLNNYFT